MTCKNRGEERRGQSCAGRVAISGGQGNAAVVSGPAFFSGTQFAQLADQYKFIVIYPSATRSGNCFDVYTQEALRRNGGSDPVGIKSMVDWTIANRAGDPNRVFVTGASSGAMMTNVLLADYPDVFKACAALGRSAKEPGGQRQP